ncbi:MAG: DUF87 domain-containing protein [Symploca sp. SIO2D2]|nr:DUF87 domain-containing protein [Symploca sp. SIO2D2]
MGIEKKVQQIASIDIFTEAKKKDLFVGRPFYFDYEYVRLLVCDGWKHQAGGIPLGCFLLCFYDNEADEDIKEAVLLRALAPTKLPTDNSVIQAMVEYYKDDLNMKGKDTDLDPETRYEFSFSGLECRALGTFYQDKAGNTCFGADVENFFSAHNYSCYKPTGQVLEMIINFRDGTIIPGNKTDVRIGKIRYSSSRRFQEQEREEVPFYVSPTDFLGKRTALFGMTRTGKSNTVKKIVQATVQINKVVSNNYNVKNDVNPAEPFTDDDVPKQSVGQLIFDINGEYANPNLQDEGTAISEIYKDKVTRFSTIDKPNFKIMKVNFYRDIEAGFDMIRSDLSNDDRQFVKNLLAVSWEIPEEEKNETGKANFNSSFMTRYQRRLVVYKCCLKRAGYTTSEDQEKIKFVGQKDLNEIVGIDPSKGISLDDAAYWWEKVYHLMAPGSINPKTNQPLKFFEEYEKKKKHSWADSDLMALLTVLTMCQHPGNKVNCNGYKRLKQSIDKHTNSVDKSYSQEIIELLRIGKIVIVDLSQGNPKIQSIYSEKICQHIFSNSMVRFIENQPNNFIQLYFEEAHNLFPRKEDKDLSQIYNRLAKEGAKLNLGIIYATQEVSSISSNILKNTQNWFVAHLNNQDELREISKFYGYEDFTKSLSRFSAANDKGFIRIKTYSNPFIVPVQVNRFSGSTTSEQ